MSSKYYGSPWKELGMTSREGTGLKKTKRKKVVCNLPTFKDVNRLRGNGSRKICPVCCGRGFTRSGLTKTEQNQVVKACDCSPDRQVK